MDFINNHILSLVIFFPLLAAVLVAFVPRQSRGVLFFTAFISSVVEFVLSLHLWQHFKNNGSFEFVEMVSWIPAWKINYLIGIDGVALLLIVLATFLMPLAILASKNSVQNKLKEYLVSLLVLQVGMVGVFASLDLFLFYVFWEVMLIPMYFLIGIWGGERRIYASIKFFIYTMAGSVLMLIAILYVYYNAGQTFNLMELYENSFTPQVQLWLFAAFGLAFAIKVPIFPLHTWLPDAHVEAPTAGSVILAGVLLKMGTYGFFRFAMPLFPDGFAFFQPYLMTLCVIGIVYGALVAMVQPDIKKLIAYSSVSHLGVVMLGLFSLNETGMMGGLYQMINHGITTGALFLLVGMVYERTHSRQIEDYSGLAKVMPWYTVCFLVATFGSIGLPLTNGFIGEFLSLAGAFQTFRISSIIAASSVVLGAVYMLWMVERVFFGATKYPGGHGITDIGRRELMVILPLLILIVWMGVAPKKFLNKISVPVSQLLLQMESRHD